MTCPADKMTRPMTQMTRQAVKMTRPANDSLSSSLVSGVASMLSTRLAFKKRGIGGLDWSGVIDERSWKTQNSPMSRECRLLRGFLVIAEASIGRMPSRTVLRRDKSTTNQ
jgi:hypothetical protein